MSDALLPIGWGILQSLLGLGTAGMSAEQERILNEQNNAMRRFTLLNTLAALNNYAGTSRGATQYLEGTMPVMQSLMTKAGIGGIESAYAGNLKDMGALYDALQSNLAAGSEQLQTLVGQTLGRWETGAGNLLSGYDVLANQIASRGGSALAALDEATNRMNLLGQQAMSTFGGLKAEDLLAAQQRYDTTMGLLGTLGSQTTQRFEELMGQDVSGYQQRYNTAMQMLEGMGEQERRDIMRQYDTLARQNAQQLVSRGLGSTILMAGSKTATERERRGALGRLDERLRQQRLGTHAALSGDTLAAQGRWTSALANLANTLRGETVGTHLGLTGEQQQLRHEWNTALANLANTLRGEQAGMAQTRAGTTIDFLNQITGAQQAKLGTQQQLLGADINLYSNLANQIFGYGQQSREATLNALGGMADLSSLYRDRLLQFGLGQIGQQGSMLEHLANRRVATEGDIMANLQTIMTGIPVEPNTYYGIGNMGAALQSGLDTMLQMWQANKLAEASKSNSGWFW